MKQSQDARPQQRLVRCPCGQHMTLKWSKQYEKWFYGCPRYPACTNTHGAHPDGRPLGKPADKETRQLRNTLHEVLEQYYDPKNKEEMAARNTFLFTHTGRHHIGNLEKGQIKQLLRKLGYTSQA